MSLAGLSNRQLALLIGHGYMGWLLCALMMVGGRHVASQAELVWAADGLLSYGVPGVQAALVGHAIGAPVVFAVIAWLYFTRYNFTSSLQTAMVLVVFVMIMDFLVVALLLEGSLDLFRSVLGTWVPFSLIFLSVYLTGTVLQTSGRTRTENGNPILALGILKESREGRSRVFGKDPACGREGRQSKIQNRESPIGSPGSS